MLEVQLTWTGSVLMQMLSGNFRRGGSGALVISDVYTCRATVSFVRPHFTAGVFKTFISVQHIFLTIDGAKLSMLLCKTG